MVLHFIIYNLLVYFWQKTWTFWFDLPMLNQVSLILPDQRVEIPILWVSRLGVHSKHFPKSSRQIFTMIHKIKQRLITHYPLRVLKDFRSRSWKKFIWDIYSKTRLKRISGDTSKNFVIALIRYIDIAKFVILYNEFVLHKENKPGTMNRSWTLYIHITRILTKSGRAPQGIVQVRGGQC